MPCSKTVKLFSIASAYLLPRASTFSFASLAIYSNKPINSGFAVGLYLHRRSRAIHWFAINEQTNN